MIFKYVSEQLSENIELYFIPSVLAMKRDGSGWFLEGGGEEYGFNCEEVLCRDVRASVGQVGR